MDRIIQDIRFGLRLLRRSPGFAFVAILTLALGIGANTAIFSLVDGVLLKPPAYHEPDRLVMVWRDWTARGGPLREWWSYPDYLDFREQSETLEDLAVYTDNSVTLTGPQTAVALPAATVSWNMLAMLGVSPERGRTFTAGDGEPGADPVTVISHAFWQQQFGGSEDAVGSTILLDGVPNTVVGVMPADFPFAFIPEPTLWQPFRLAPDAGGRGNVFLRTVGRLAPGVSLETCRTELAGIAAAIAQDHPEADRGVGSAVFTLQSELTGPVAPYLYLLLAAVGLVLLIACANVANLLLARGSSRRNEIAIRAAVGAGRSRLATQLITESMLLALLGGAAGSLFAMWGVDALKGLVVGVVQVPGLARVGLHGGVLLFAVGVSVLTGLIFGLAPAIHAMRTDLRAALVSADRGGDERSGRRFRTSLVIVEVALSLMLLSGAGLLTRSLSGLIHVDTGFRSEGLLTFDVFLPGQTYSERTDRLRFMEGLRAGLERIPGIEGIGMSSSLPLKDYNTDATLRVEGRPEPPPGQDTGVWYRQVDPGYLGTMGIPIIRGRGIIEADREDSERVVVVNETFVRREFDGEDPIGKRLLSGSTAFRIVGVAADARYFDLRREVPPACYLAARQSPPMHMGFVLRTPGDPASLATAARQAVSAVDPAVAPVGMITMEDQVAASVATERVATMLLALFAMSALLLAAVGLYGVMSYQVLRRQREIGIRMAMGAEAGLLLRLVVSEGMRLSLLGVVLGLLGALALTRLMGSLLYGIAPWDPLTLAGVAVLMGGVSFLATWLPARRASRTDPVRVLRSE